MLYAKVVFGLPVEGPFDYIIPEALHKKIKVGMRVWVPFRNQRKVGYVIKVVKKTGIHKIKPILKTIDDFALLDENMLVLAKELSDYYCCSLGEAIETSLPEPLRKGKPLPVSGLDTLQDAYTPKTPSAAGLQEESGYCPILIHDLDGIKRWDIYLKEIKNTLDILKSAIIILPDKNAALKTKDRIDSIFKVPSSTIFRKGPGELVEWVKIREGKVNIVVGTRSAIFAPLKNLGLIIVDEEADQAYKQDQVPHYHLREIALMRAKIERARIILGSTAPSLESFYLTKKSKARYVFFPRDRDFPEIKILDTKNIPWNFKKRQPIISLYLEDAIRATIQARGRSLLFLNRRGFATLAACVSCGMALKCPRCSINLVYHFKDKKLTCHYCGFNMPIPQICPFCNSGYIRYSGAGTEKLESELFRIFPQAKIKMLDKDKVVDFLDGEIFISTQAILKNDRYCFDLIGILAIDNSLNRLDFRASEKTFALLCDLLKLTDKKMIIQTRFVNHHCFLSLVNKDINAFYEEELRQRRQLGFPPFKHLGLIKIRGPKEERVKVISADLFARLKKENKSRGIKIIALNEAQPAKLRGNFYWQILIRANSVDKLSRFLKSNLKNFSHSGIIVTVDIDPV